MRAGLYVRLSKRKAAPSNGSGSTDRPAALLPEAQIKPLVRYARAREMEIVHDEDGSACYIDNGVSGARDRRPALDRLMDRVRRREVDAIVVMKLDRLARSVAHLTRLGGELEALGVGLVVVDQAIDTTTPAGKLLFHVLGAIAEFERDLIRERTLAGLEVARARGKRLGRRPALDPIDCKRIDRLRRTGKSINQITEIVGKSRSVVARELRRQKKGGNSCVT